MPAHSTIFRLTGANVPMTVERVDKRTIIRMEGEFTVTSAVELKSLLLEGLASSGELEVDLTGAGEIDVSLLQLLWTAGREAQGQGGRIVRGVKESAKAAAREAGFESFPGTGGRGAGGG